MELRTVNGKLRPKDAFRLIATGYLLGSAAVFVPLFALAGVLMFVSTRAVGGGSASMVTPFVMLPLILAMQSIVIGGLVVLGLWLYQQRRPIRVVDVARSPAL